MFVIQVDLYNEHKMLALFCYTYNTILNKMSQYDIIVASLSIQPFGHNRHGLKIGGCAPFGEDELGPHLTQCGQGRGLPPCPVSSFTTITVLCSYLTNSFPLDAMLSPLVNDHTHVGGIFAVFALQSWRSVCTCTTLLAQY